MTKFELNPNYWDQIYNLTIQNIYHLVMSLHINILKLFNNYFDLLNFIVFVVCMSI